jgi:NitT/TauT family transport system ATP-binding protein
MSATPAIAPEEPILSLEGIRKTFPRPDGRELLVLDDVHLQIRRNEIVGLIGRSGSGKSTLLRIIAGLSEPVAGTMRYLGAPLRGPAPGIAMVFQSFALFPWLTVYDNVALGLEALHLPKQEIRQRTLAAIDLIGLDGFESAYPRELSGGMRQRVGFARALVVHPCILLMDEPFSSLDVLTAETLRGDFLELWSQGRMPIEAVVLVTHNIEEAVLMSDRILIIGSNPGRMVCELRIDLPHPRSRLDVRFQELVDRIYEALTAMPREPGAGPVRLERFTVVTMGTVLPPVSPTRLGGFMEAVCEQPFDGKADLPQIAAHLQLHFDELLPVAEALQMLRFAEVAGGDIRLVDAARAFVAAEPDERKRLFAQHLLAYVPIAALIRRVLDDRASHTAPRRRFVDELEDYMSSQDAEQTLRVATTWGRYAEVFAYDEDTGTFSLENPT